MSGPRLPRSRYFFCVALSLCLGTWLLFHHLTYDSTTLARASEVKHQSYESHDEAQKILTTESNTSRLVPLEAHIMSKCPDARDCLRDLVVPAMEKVVDMVDFNLSFIGKIDSDDTIQCKHGPKECLGNMLSLCARDLFPNNTVISLGFTTCLVLSYPRIPDRDLVENCALEHGIAFEAINTCVSDNGKGLDLLRASVERSQEADVIKSCTVTVVGKTWCVRDGAEWKDCDGGSEPEDLVAEIKRLYKSA